MNTFGAAAISSIAHRVDFHTWIVDPFSQIASHISLLFLKKN